MDLTVPRAVLITALSKNEIDNPDIARDDATIFVKTLLRTVDINTNSNVTLVTTFVTRNILRSVARTTALIKFLTAVARSCAPEVENALQAEKTEDERAAGSGDQISPPVPAYKRLHLLYIVHNIVLFATLKSKRDNTHGEILQFDLQAMNDLVEQMSKLALFMVCSDDRISNDSKDILQKAESLLRVWQKYDIMPNGDAFKRQLQEAHESSWEHLCTKLADDEAQAAVIEHRQKEESNKWLIPKTHALPHDPKPQWHELPAMNGLFQRRMHGYPLRAAAFPVGGYSLQRAGQMADEATRKEVEDLLDEVSHCFDDFTNADDVEDVDALGNYIWKAETGRKTRNHWGWSYEGIKRRKLEEASGPDR